MSQRTGERADKFYAETYDSAVQDWPGEMDFYRDLTLEVKRQGGAILEVACGTGRVLIRLARGGVIAVGLDRSAHMLAVARRKSVGLTNIKWVQADMRSFDLGESYKLAIIPGHAFQNLNSPEDQVACLVCIRRHLDPGGILVVHLDHQNTGWLAGLLSGKGGTFEPAGQFRHPITDQKVRTSRAWWYEPASQTAVYQTRWEVLAEDEDVLECWQTNPTRLHCVFRFEMEHLLARAGFVIESVYGDFYRQPLSDESSEMIWVASRPLAEG